MLAEPEELFMFLRLRTTASQRTGQDSEMGIMNQSKIFRCSDKESLPLALVYAT